MPASEAWAPHPLRETVLNIPAQLSSFPGSPERPMPPTVIAPDVQDIGVPVVDVARDPFTKDPTFVE